MNFEYQLLVIGGGGHLRSLLPILRRLRLSVYGIIDLDVRKGLEINGIPVVGTDRELEKFVRCGLKAVIAIGSIGDRQRDKKRVELFEIARKAHIQFATIISDRAILSENVRVGQGSMIFDGCIINCGVTIGDNCIINTGTIIEHDCSVGDHSHIAPGTIVGGQVTIGENVFIGLGSRIMQGITIGKNAIVGAGSVVIEDAPSNSTVVGIPAKCIYTGKGGPDDGKKTKMV